MATYSVVESNCCEMHATRRESFDGVSATGIVQLKVPWASRYAVMMEIVGGKAAWPHPGIYAFGSSAGCRPLEAAGETAGQSLEYEYALIDFTYKSPGSGKDDPDDPVNLVSESLEPTVEFLTLDHKRFIWKSDLMPLLEKEAPGRQIKGMNLVRTFYNVEPPIPISILNLAGSVNDATVNSTILGLSFPAETLLFNQPSLSRTIKTDGSGLAFNITTKFTYKKEGWNKFWRQKTQIYDEIYDLDDQANVYKNYPPEDYGDLF